MMKSSTSFGFSSSLVFFFFIVASIAVYSEGSVCLYTLTVHTGSVAEAGTDSVIGVTIGNFVGESVRIPNLIKHGVMPPDHVYFQSGNQELFALKALCITTPVCKITVTADGRGQKPKWYLEYVSVNIEDPNNDLLSSQTDTKFMFNQWIAVDLPPYDLTASHDVCGVTASASINDM